MIEDTGTAASLFSNEVSAGGWSFGGRDWVGFEESDRGTSTSWVSSDSRIEAVWSGVAGS